MELAIEGKFDFLRKTNPWRTKEDIEAEEFEKNIGPENVAERLHAWALQMQGKKPDRSNRGERVKEGVVLPPGMEMPIVPDVVKKG